jgi:hypothetical protein
MKRTVKLQKALRALSGEGFWLHQKENEETGEMWVVISQTLRDVNGQPFPYFAGVLEVMETRKGGLVVDRQELEAFLDLPSELPADYIPGVQAEEQPASMSEIVQEQMDELAAADESDAEEDELVEGDEEMVPALGRGGRARVAG